MKSNTNVYDIENLIHMLNDAEKDNPTNKSKKASKFNFSDFSLDI